MGDFVTRQLGEKYPFVLRSTKEAQNGLAHRLDQDTSGPLVLAANLRLMNRLRGQNENRGEGETKWYKEYLALMHGRLPDEKVVGKICYRLEEDKKAARHKQRARRTDGKPAETHYQAERVYRRAVDGEVRWYTLVRVSILTGRTHQIRVHLTQLSRKLRLHDKGPIGLVADDMYLEPSSTVREDGDLCKRMFLHCHVLRLPARGSQGA